MEWTVVERLVDSGAAIIEMVDLAAFGTVLNQHTFNIASSNSHLSWMELLQSTNSKTLFSSTFQDYLIDRQPSPNCVSALIKYSVEH